MFKLWMRSIAVGTAVAAIFLSMGVVHAQSWQHQEFFKELNERAPFYRLNFWQAGLRSVNRIRFSDDGTDRYHPLQNIIVLGESYGDSGGRLKTWSKLGALNLGTLAHESFHAYLQNYVRKSSALMAQRQWMDSRPAALYPDLSETKGRITLEEAYASFIGSMVTSHLTLSRMLEMRGKDEERCESTVKTVDRLWRASWNQEVKGYYSRDGIGEYWVDTWRQLWADLRGADSGIPPDGTYFVETPIAELDKVWVSKQMFGEKIQASTRLTFAHLLRDLPCYEKAFDSQSENHSE